MRDTFVKCLIERAKIDKRIYVISPDMGFSVFEEFIKRYPNRFLNVGIAEQNAIGVAAGVALSGKIVYVYSIIPFVNMRCYEQVRVDVAYMNSNVKLVGIGAGFTYGSAGLTHQAIEDIAIMRSMPNMTVCAPGDPCEVEQIVKQSFLYKGPMYIRLAKNKEPMLHSHTDKITIGKASIMRKGKDIALLATSNLLATALRWSEEWRKEGIKAAVVSMHTIKPLDYNYIRSLINKKIPIITLEEHNIIGGLGSAVAEIIAESGMAIKFKRIGIQDIYSHFVGSAEFQRKKFNLINKPDLRKFFTK
ncbi:MAG: 1-deoxy-D-xylulose-5-phosphate synthase [Candidatus Margulisbacteria bacterium]|nr:1-deoxy-D-xylulose-5-phosphate synthase [Candidatus Margulisiibacteriota bacterium]